MPKKSAANLADIIEKIFTEQSKVYMTVNQLLDALKKHKNEIDSLVEIRKDNIERLVGNKFIFRTKQSKYILKPCEASELVLAEISKKSGKSPKQIAQFLPITKKEFHEVLNELADEGKVKIILTETLDARVYLTEGNKETSKQKTKTECTLEEFRSAFNKLDKGKIFVRICDLRRELNWPREVFDEMLVKLRDEEVIQLQVGDASTMTKDEVKNSFIDENNFRMSLVTWNDR